MGFKPKLKPHRARWTVRGDGTLHATVIIARLPQPHRRAGRADRRAGRRSRGRAAARQPRRAARRDGEGGQPRLPAAAHRAERADERARRARGARSSSLARGGGGAGGKALGGGGVPSAAGDLGDGRCRRRAAGCCGRRTRRSTLRETALSLPKTDSCAWPPARRRARAPSCPLGAVRRDDREPPARARRAVRRRARARLQRKRARDARRCRGAGSWTRRALALNLLAVHLDRAITPCSALTRRDDVLAHRAELESARAGSMGCSEFRLDCRSLPRRPMSEVTAA